MDYYRTNIAGGVVQPTTIDTNNAILNSANDSYASNYWSVPYSDGLSPMKQIEGKNQRYFRWLFNVFSNYTLEKKERNDLKLIW